MCTVSKLERQFATLCPFHAPTGPPFLFYEAPPRQFQPPKCQLTPSKNKLGRGDFCAILHKNCRVRGFAKGWFPKGWVHSDGLGGCSPHQKAERGYIRMFLGTKTPTNSQNNPKKLFMFIWGQKRYHKETV